MNIKFDPKMSPLQELRAKSRSERTAIEQCIVDAATFEEADHYRAMGLLEQAAEDLEKLYRNVGAERRKNPNLTVQEFDEIHEAGKRLKEIFKRDNFKGAEGAEDYIVRAVQEAT